MPRPSRRAFCPARGRLPRRRALALGLLVAVVALTTWAAGCASGPVVMGDPDDFADRIRTLEQRLADDPDDPEALRDLGVVYVRAQRPAQAYSLLKRAAERDADDPRTLFFFGLASEQVGRREAALDLFARYEQVPASSRYRELMRGRYAWLSRQAARDQLRERLTAEQQDSRLLVSARVLAVLPLDYEGEDERYAPLGRGLSQLILSDLANIGDLTVVERIRLQALLDEIELGRSEAIDPSTAPRAGRLLGAGRLVGGSYTVTRGRELQVNFALAEIARGGRFPDLGSQTAPLREIIQLQKRAVFRILDEFNIQITPAEREAIEKIPTEDLQAFLAFCRGLESESQGAHAVAAQFFGQAVALDPGFEMAASMKEEAEGLSKAGGADPTNAIASAEGLPLPPELDPMQSRVGNVSNAIFHPSERQPGEESTTGGLVPDAELPEPPDPPSSTSGN
jgi:tetratricopeptide (TPR) repeat protein